MKLLCLLLTVLMTTATGCATLAQRRCSALEEQLEKSNRPCNDCKDRLLPEDQQLCASLCAHPGEVGPATTAACTPRAPEPVESAPAASEPEVAAATP
ncbi:hypothetical protein [Myxococcus sp. CA040A]|uniref:hypothetical protein n=1 Tax=Myxococcus sp. CA040A TaxID=2741738 RepID=UPI00157B2B13|nr:hypothetical protein [Myxococcus sp. CA040A]NTX08962.1 hypothetical protein [Myxococcus sp. CA040A]